MKVTSGPADRRHALFGGRGDVLVWNLSADEAPAPPFVVVLSCELDPDGRVGPHHQAEYPEIVVFLEGEGAASVDGTSRDVGPGAVVSLPLGSILSITNRSQTEPLRYLIIKAKQPIAPEGSAT
ncbi:MAG TPA: cupin domain-containing protein [Byssovorax sp.]|jgi:quercetin dioxygenase-like cupin family protein